MVLRILVLTSVILVSGCATLPPAKSISDVSSIVGKWEGTYDSFQDRQPLTMTFKTDGTYGADARILVDLVGEELGWRRSLQG